MATQHTGNVEPSVDLEEHRSLGGVNAKAVTEYVFDGSALVPKGGSLAPGIYDAIVTTYPDAVTEVYTYKTGGTGGTTVYTLTIVYTDSTKQSVSTMVKT